YGDLADTFAAQIVGEVDWIVRGRSGVRVGTVAGPRPGRGAEPIAVIPLHRRQVPHGAHVAAIVVRVCRRRATDRGRCEAIRAGHVVVPARPRRPAGRVGEVLQVAGAVVVVGLDVGDNRLAIGDAHLELERRGDVALIELRLGRMLASGRGREAIGGVVLV